MGWPSKGCRHKCEHRLLQSRELGNFQTRGFTTSRLGFGMRVSTSQQVSHFGGLRSSCVRAASAAAGFVRSLTARLTFTVQIL